MRNGDPEFQKAMELQDKLQPAGLQFAYGGLNKPITEEENWKDMKISINLWMNWIQHEEKFNNRNGMVMGLFRERLYWYRCCYDPHMRTMEVSTAYYGKF
jgi:hypothetical protein